MKQHITKKQWDELDEKQKLIFSDIVLPGWKNKNISSYWNGYPNIGQMIEFLGDEWFIYLPTIGRGKEQHKNLGVEGLCNNLWQAVKYKLKEK